MATDIPMTIKIVVERSTGRMIGAQIVGGAGAAKRIDTCAVAITARMTIDQIVDLDLAYAPPFSPTWDPVAVVADAVTSRKTESASLALARLRHAGVSVVNTEMVLFEWLNIAGTPEFKDLSKLIK